MGSIIATKKPKRSIKKGLINMSKIWKKNEAIKKIPIILLLSLYEFHLLIIPAVLFLTGLWQWLRLVFFQILFIIFRFDFSVTFLVRSLSQS